MSRLPLDALAPILADYRKAFPAWRPVGPDCLVRLAGPLAQVIWFDRLRTGEYRPTCRVHVLVAPGSQGGTPVLSQFLSPRARQATARTHPQRLAAIVHALRTEVEPSPDQPLDARQVATLLASRSLGRPANAFAVACLFGALGDMAATEHWIIEYDAAVAQLGLAPQPIDSQRGAFLGILRQWLLFPDRQARFKSLITQQTALLLSPSASACA